MPKWPNYIKIKTRRKRRGRRRQRGRSWRRGRKWRWKKTMRLLAEVSTPVAWKSKVMLCRCRSVPRVLWGSWLAALWVHWVPSHTHTPCVTFVGHVLCVCLRVCSSLHYSGLWLRTPAFLHHQRRKKKHHKAPFRSATVLLFHFLPFI